VLVVVARLGCTLCRGDDAKWTPALWRDTVLKIAPEGNLRRFGRWRNWLTGEVGASTGEEEPTMQLQALFAAAGGLPFAVLVAQGEPAA
jgi:(1->4)-alpha-D-glucan 1-alpha-D-glucosylmutase